jgi:anti-anti-sigma regulatory factor
MERAAMMLDKHDAKHEVWSFEGEIQREEACIFEARLREVVAASSVRKIVLDFRSASFVHPSFIDKVVSLENDMSANGIHFVLCVILASPLDETLNRLRISLPKFYQLEKAVAPC